MSIRSSLVVIVVAVLCVAPVASVVAVPTASTGPRGVDGHSGSPPRDVATVPADAGLDGPPATVATDRGGSPFRQQSTDLTSGPITAVIDAPATVEAGVPVTLNGSDSTVQNGSVVVYAWDLTGDGIVDATGRQVDHTFATPGTHTVGLAVVGSNGAVEVTSARVRVTGTVTGGPTANISVSNTTVRTGESIGFDARNSSTSDGRIVRYAWQFGDNTSATGERAFHEFESPGTYPVRLTVTDAAGRTNTTTVSVKVRAGEPRPVDIVRVVPDKRGSIVNDVILRNTYSAKVNASTTVDRVVFRLRNRTYVDRNGSDGWSASIDVSVLEGDAPLSVTAVGTNGSRDTYTAVVDVVDLPDWLVDIVRNGNVSYRNGTVTMNRSVVVPPASIGLEPFGDIPVLDLRQYAYARGSFGVEYDMPDGTAVALAEGRVRLDVPAAPLPTGEGSLTGRGYFVTDGEDWTLRRGRVEASVEVEVFAVGYDVNQDLPDWIPYDFPGAEVAVSPTGRFEGAVGVQREQLRLREGTLSPGARAEATFTLTVPGAPATVRGQLGGQLTASADVPPPYNLRGQASLSGEMTAEALGQTVTVTAGPYRAGVGRVGTSSTGVPRTGSVDGGTTTSSGGWTVIPRDGVSPLPFDDATGTDAGTPVRAAVVDDTDDAFGTAAVTERLTADRVADRSPTLTSLGDGAAGLVWSRQSPSKPTLDGRDVYWRRWSDGGWSDPVAVTDDRRFQLEPVVAHDQSSDRTLAVWTVVDEPVDGSVPPTAHHDAFEIAYAVRTADGWSDPVQLTHDDTMDAAPTVAVRGGQFVVAWTSDADATVTTATDRRVELAVIDPDGAIRRDADGTDGSATSSEPALLARGTVPNASGPAVAAGDSDGARVAYRTAPGDRNGTVVVGRVALPAGADDPTPGDPARIDVRRDTRVSVTGFVDAAAAGDRVVVVDGGPVATRIRTVTDRGTHRIDAGTGTRLRGVRDVSIATRGDRSVVAVHARAADAQRSGLFTFERTAPNASVSTTNGQATARWAGPTQVARDPAPNATLWDGTVALTTTGPTVASTVSGAEPNARGELVATRLRPASGVATDGTTAEERGSVATADRVPTLRVSDVSVERYGDRLTVTAAVSNRGNGTADAVAVELADRGGQRTLLNRTVPALAAGETRRVAVAVDADRTSAGHTSVLRVTPLQDLPLVQPVPFTRGRDRQELRLLRPALSVAPDSVRVYDVGSSTLTRVTVANTGTGPGSAAVQLRHDGRVVATRSVTVPAPAGDVAFAVATLRTPSLSADERVVATLDSDFEADATDNAANVSVRLQDPISPFPLGLPGGSSDRIPVDTDGDGLVEDMDGDGRFRFVDVVEFVFAIQNADYSRSARTSAQIAALDHSGDGRVSFVDVIDLVFEL